MLRIRILRIPLVSLVMIFGTGLALILFCLSVVGLFIGGLKELIIYISSTQAVAPKAVSFNTNPVNVLITQE